MKILITSAGRRVSLVRSFQKELRKIDPYGKVYTADSNPTLSAACHTADAYFEVPRLDTPNYIEVLINLCIEHEINLVIPTIDTELVELAENKIKFESQGIKVVISSVEFVSKCRDKREIHKFFVEHQIKVATEFSKDNYQLPLFIKPIDGSRSVNAYVIRSQKDFKDEHFSNDKFMFLEYLDHYEYDEFTCDLYYNKDHKLKCVVPRKRLEVRDGEVYKAVTQSNCLIPYIKEKLDYISGAVGCLTAQFFLHKRNLEEIYGIEINPRFGGGYPLTYLSGANFSKWILEEYLQNKTIGDKFAEWESDLLMVRYDDEILVHGYKG